MDKDSLRAEMKAKRKNFGDKEGASKKIFSHLVNSPFYKESKNICAYMSAFGEVETGEILRHALSIGKGVCVPVSGEDLSLKLSKTDGEFIRGLYGIKEPVHPDFVDFSFPDLILVPGLAFSEKGDRLGFGKGYYDRFLSEAKGLKVGLCYGFQIVPSLPSEPHDVRLDAVITESGVTVFG